MGCPGFDKLIDFLDGGLSPKEARGVEEHMAEGCKKCVGTRDWYERVRLLARSDTRFDPAPWAHRRAIALFEERAKRKPRPGAGLAIARLIYDSLQQPLLAGTRSERATQRQLVYQTGDHSVELQIVPLSKSNAEVVGQVLPRGESGFSSVAGILVDLMRKEESVWSTLTNDNGEFIVSDVGMGEYDLLVETGGRPLRIPGLDISLSR
jgi:hypothetical protein